MRTLGGEVARGHWRWSAVDWSPIEPFAVGGVAVLVRWTAVGPAAKALGLIVRCRTGGVSHNPVAVWWGSLQLP